VKSTANNPGEEGRASGRKCEERENEKQKHKTRTEGKNAVKNRRAVTLVMS
jgi:hypothetical protein